MISIKIYRNNQNQICEFNISGHANAEAHGKDIVCAAVSVLGQTTILGLYEVLEIKATYKIDNGYLQCSIPDDLTEKQRYDVNILLETMVVGLKNIKAGYYEYIDIHDKEV
ncbi:ribosomal-processing cysteine protease Prp [Alkaliphilus pronyensis]|uniref:Ribosomal processing cysteine protease Prp n=1 Tax=Alkaliphilus pronyensis TaxID=1482732 RepID=A0A6I0F3H5_9FIRM|nr:ribosomal-processing cysteine protease Prp [Alkaliphilus pronyensis]KAB3535902.1 ribosomal-processing cysteine protease Prp [Alkaliphilus pronyensis]